jgi:glycosyltransferase EpsF
MNKIPCRILHVFGTMNCGGAETRIMELYRHIDRQNVQFDFLVLNNDKHYYSQEIQRLGGRVFAVTNPRVSMIRHIVDMYKLMKSQGPFQAVHSHTSFHSGISLFVAKMAGIKYRVCHARTTSTKNSKSMLKRIQLFIGRKLISNFSTSFLAISQQSAKYLFGDKMIKRDLVSIVPNAINLQPYKKNDLNNIINLKKELKISGDTLTIGHVGRFNFMKNHKFIIELANSLKVNNIKFKIILVGDGEMKNEIEQRVLNQNLKENFEFLGVRKDIPQLMKVFDVLIMPSLFEGLGGVVIEAQAAGTPSLVSDNLPEEVDMGVGLVEFLPISSPEKWSDKLVKSNFNRNINIEKIHLNFQGKKFTLEHEEEALYKAYGVAGK